MKNKRGQIKLSFGMIFSIILIIIFISFAIYGVSKFLGLQKNIQVQQFGDNLQNDVDKIWKANQGSQPVSYALPNKVQKVCFRDYEFGENMVFQSEERIPGMNINHLNIEEMTKEGNYCIDVEGGKVSMILSKEYGEALVTITSQ